MICDACNKPATDHGELTLCPRCKAILVREFPNVAATLTKSDLEIPGSCGGVEGHAALIRGNKWRLVAESSGPRDASAGPAGVESGPQDSIPVFLSRENSVAAVSNPPPALMTVAAHKFDDGIPESLRRAHA